jgi:hypothetical protein
MIHVSAKPQQATGLPVPHKIKLTKNSTTPNSPSTVPTEAEASSSGEEEGSHANELIEKPEENESYSDELSVEDESPEEESSNGDDSSTKRSNLPEEVLYKGEASTEDGQPQRNEPSEDGLSWNKAAGNCDEARPALRAMPQTSFLSEGGAATPPLQQFHPQYGLTSFNTTLSCEYGSLLSGRDIWEGDLVKDSGLSGA